MNASESGHEHGSAPAQSTSGSGISGRRRAVALSYDGARDSAPMVTAAGSGAVAEEIIRRAREAGVTVTEDPALATALAQLDPGQVIPEELYAVVAEVLAYVYRLDARIGQRRPR